MADLSYKIGDNIVVIHKQTPFTPEVKVTGRVLGFIVDVSGKGLATAEHAGGGGDPISYVTTVNPAGVKAAATLAGGRRKRRMTRHRK